MNLFKDTTHKIGEHTIHARREWVPPSGPQPRAQIRVHIGIPTETKATFIVKCFRANRPLLNQPLDPSWGRYNPVGGCNWQWTSVYADTAEQAEQLAEQRIEEAIGALCLVYHDYLKRMEGEKELAAAVGVPSWVRGVTS